MNRRAILIGGAAGLTAHTIGAGAQSFGASAQGPRQSRMPHLLFADDPQFWFETLRVIGAADYGGAQFGEAMMTASRITSGDYDGWHDQWKATADAVAAEAQASLMAGRRVSARDGFLRASNHYRNAEFFLHANPADPHMRHAYERSVACFRQAAGLFDVPVEPVEIPYERTTLPGYFYRALIIMHNGFDGSVEEMHFLGAQGGERLPENYQPETRRRRNLNDPPSATIRVRRCVPFTTQTTNRSARAPASRAKSQAVPDQRHRRRSRPSGVRRSYRSRSAPGRAQAHRPDPRSR
jgi:hypothetical protein